ncbi:MAG: DUF4838 domain-containing protein [Victivallales bacterium]|nr:DUF4838 domain-containing protein [Victivallales bacterium]
MKRVLALLTAGVLATASALDIAQRGKPADCSIVIAENAAKPYLSAANELQKFVEEMTGVKLPIVSDNEPLPPKAVVIGDTKYATSLILRLYEPGTFSDDNYLLLIRGNHLVIYGKQRGAQYGVYDILERFGGCQWYSSWCSKIPKHDKFSVPDDLDVFEEPAFMMREPFWFDMFNTMQAVRNRCNGNRMNLSADNGGKIAFGGGLFVHTFSKLVPPEEFFATHPEYFSEIGGKRMNGYYQLCLSNPQVKRIVIERMKKIIGESIKKDPSAKIFSLSQNDTRNPCACKECSKLLEKYGTQSGVMIWFVNQVAEEIEKDYPEALIETLAYQYTRQPPQNIRPRKNVIPRLCTIECDFGRGIAESNDPQTASFIKDIEGWASMTDKLFIWDYVTDFAHYITPFPNFYSLQKNIQLFRDSHVVALMSQGAYQGYHADFAELKGWLGAKMMWNPDMDIKPYVDDFFSKDGYYGAGGPFIRQYFDELHDLVKDPSIHIKIWLGPSAKWLTDDFLLHATDLFSKAEDAVKDDPVHLYNVRKASIPVYYARFDRLPKENVKFAWNGTTMAPVNASPLRLQLAKTLIERFDEKLDGVDRPIKICESTPRHQLIYNNWANLAKGRATTSITSNGNFLAALPDMNAMLAVFQPEGSKNLLDVAHGGVSYNLSTQTAFGTTQVKQDARPYKVVNAKGDEINLEYSQKGHSLSTVKFKSAPNSTLKADFITRCDAPNGLKDVSPTASFALALGNATNICYRLGNGEWKEKAANIIFKNDTFAVKSAELNGNDTIAIVAPSTGKSATIKFTKDRVEKILLRIFSDSGSVAVIFCEKKGLAAKQTATSHYDVQFGNMEAPAPSIAYDKNIKHGVKVLSTDICLSKIGEWCYLEDDDDASCGTAIRLTNTHYEWCLRYFMKESALDVNTKYNVRIRAKVVKDAPAGNAFSAGIYDATAKRGAIKGVSVKVEDAPEDYKWYDMGAYTLNPVNDQWFWAAPGTFNKANAKSAVKKVMIDCLEFTPAE